MGAPTRRAVLKGTAEVAGLADPAQAAPAGASSGYPKANFAQDVPLPEARVLAAVQKAIAGSSFAEPAGPPAWKTLPSWLPTPTRSPG
jgi:hypothetical protein